MKILKSIAVLSAVVALVSFTGCNKKTSAAQSEKTAQKKIRFQKP